MNPSEPKPPEGKAIAPSWMSAAAKKHWQQMSPMLEQMRVLTVADASALGHLCEAQVNYVRARKKEDDPAMRQWQDRVEKWLVHFGLTPASRAKVKATPATEADPFEELLSRRGRRTG